MSVGPITRDEVTAEFFDGTARGELSAAQVFGLWIRFHASSPAVPRL